MEQFASLADIYPTILSLAGVDYPREELHGASLEPLIDGNGVGWPEHVVTEFNGVNNVPLTQRTLRWGDLKYGYNCSGPDELYDLSRDPWETMNLIDNADYYQAARELRQRMIQWMEETGDPVLHIFRGNKVGYYDGKRR